MRIWFASFLRERKVVHVFAFRYRLRTKFDELCGRFFVREREFFRWLFERQAVDKDEVGGCQFDRVRRRRFKCMRVCAFGNHARQFDALAANVVNNVDERTDGADNFQFRSGRIRRREVVCNTTTCCQNEQYVDDGSRSFSGIRARNRAKLSPCRTKLLPPLFRN